MSDENAWTYWSRSDANSMVLNLGSNPAARRGLARAMEAWISHLLRIRVSIEPVTKIEDRDFKWFVGLDSEATRIGNALWRGQSLAPEDIARAICFFRLDFENKALVDDAMRGRPVWLILAMDQHQAVRMKPQNLVAGLPLKSAQEKRT